MQPPARLKWRREAGRFAAYPLGPHQPDMIAIVSPPVHVDASWAWRITWPGWFLEQGYGLNNQAAADAATEQWWTSVATEVPRDIDAEVLLIAARVMVRPPPNSLYSEDTAFLTKLIGLGEITICRGAQAGRAASAGKRPDEQPFTRAVPAPEGGMRSSGGTPRTITVQLNRAPIEVW